MTEQLDDEVRACTKDLGRLERYLRTCDCGRVCRTGGTFIRHRQRCKVPTPEEPDEEREWADLGARLGRTLRRINEEKPPIPLQINILALRLDRFMDTIQEMGNEIEVIEGVQGLGAELIRVLYEVLPPHGQ